MAVIAVIVVVALVGVFDMASNAGKAFGNVSVNGINVSGMTKEQIQDVLREEYAPRVSHSQITIYASDEVNDLKDELSAEEARAIAEQISVEEANETKSSWQADSLSLKASLPVEEAADSALAVGRSDGGVVTRLGLLLGSHDVEMGVNFDSTALDALAQDIDNTIGDPRIDATVAVEDGKAHAVEGHDGFMVDREWLAYKLSEAFLSEEEASSFVAQAFPAKSRITMEQAENMADAVNRAITPGANIEYHGKQWKAGATDIGSWTTVETVEKGDGFDLKASIDPAVAVPAVVKGADAVITSENMTVTFEVNGDEVFVHTQGSGNIPEVTQAVSDLDNALYGEGGTAWNGGDAVSVSIEESDRPESLSFEQALELGIITEIGTYTTEFSTQEGTENRNHNIRLAADLLNNGIIEANGGQWDFNDRSGNTNEAAGFWEAGSIIDGEYVDSVGGGICQVATTVFNAAYEAGLEIVERHNHSLYIASYPTGRDAAVDYPTMTLVWKNDLPSDILMKTSYSEGSVTVTLYSVYTGYKAETETGEWQEGGKYGTRFEVDDSIGAGNYYRKTVGEDGQSITIMRTVTDDEGTTVRNDTFASVYEPKDEVYVIGPEVDTSKLQRVYA